MLLAGSSVAASFGFFPFLTSLVEGVLFVESAFDFSDRRGFSSSEDVESDSELELEETSELTFRFVFLLRPLTVGLGGLAFPTKVSFSSSASLSETELEEDPNEDEAFLSFLIGFAVGLNFLDCRSESLSSLLPLLDVSSCSNPSGTLPSLSLARSESSSSLVLDASSDSAFT